MSTTTSGLRARCVVALTAALVLATADHATAGDGSMPTATSGLSITVEQGHVSLAAEGVAIGAVLHALAERTGVRVVLHGGADTPISTRFSRLPIDDAFRRVLRGRAYTLEYAADGDGRRLDRLIVLGGLPRPAPEAQPTVREAAAPPAAEIPDAVRAAIVAASPGISEDEIRAIVDQLGMTGLMSQMAQGRPPAAADMQPFDEMVRRIAEQARARAQAR